MGGLDVVCTRKLSDIDFDNTAMLILPGGDAWERKELQEIIPIVEKCIQKQIPIAAICAATTLLAEMKLLDSIKHTSNAKSYLVKFAPHYNGQESYVGQDGFSDPTAVADGNIITSSGLASVEFAREIFQLLKVYDARTIEKWYQLFKNGVWQD